MGKNQARLVPTLLVLAMVPLLLAIIIHFPAGAGTPDDEVEVPRPTDVSVLEPAGGDPAAGFEVILDTGPVGVGYESKISALALRVTPGDESTIGSVEEVGTTTSSG